MSSNTNLLERASFVKDVYTDTILEKSIDKAIEENDLERLEFIITQAEAEIAKDELYGADMLPKEFGDAY